MAGYLDVLVVDWEVEATPKACLQKQARTSRVLDHRQAPAVFVEDFVVEWADHDRSSVEVGPKEVVEVGMVAVEASAMASTADQRVHLVDQEGEVLLTTVVLEGMARVRSTGLLTGIETVIVTAIAVVVDTMGRTRARDQLLMTTMMIRGGEGIDKSDSHGIQPTA